MAAHLLKQNICNARKVPEVTYTDCVLQRTNSTKRQTGLLFWARAGHSSAEIIPDCSEKHSENTQLYTLHYSFQGSQTIPFNIPKKKKEIQQKLRVPHGVLYTQTADNEGEKNSPSTAGSRDGYSM